MAAMFITAQALLANAGVTALVGTKVHPINAPQDEPPPQIVVQLVSEADGQRLEGPDLWFDSRVSVECRAQTATAAVKIGEAVKTALQGIRRQTIAGRQASFFKEETDVSDYSEASAGSPTPIYRRVLDFRCRWR